MVTVAIILFLLINCKPKHLKATLEFRFFGVYCMPYEFMDYTIKVNHFHSFKIFHRFSLKKNNKTKLFHPLGEIQYQIICLITKKDFIKLN